jgi:hypothetical protein
MLQDELFVQELQADPDFDEIFSGRDLKVKLRRERDQTILHFNQSINQSSRIPKHRNTNSFTTTATTATTTTTNAASGITATTSVINCAGVSSTGGD